jgi:2-dehydro-3-deoxyphosphooctonate aldolase (KDO 8-P synthase)
MEEQMVSTQGIRLGPIGASHPVVIGGRDLVVIAGPCVIESPERTRRIAEGLAEVCDRAGVSLVFKASFDKANRTSVGAYRGPGLEAGLDILSRIRTDLKLPVTTDIHSVAQAAQTAAVVDLIQIPAFLCRQTDLLLAAAETGVPVNIKKGQFQAPWDMAHAVEKVQSVGNSAVMLTERGTSFGYNNLVVDMRSLSHLAGLGVPVCFDATHSTQAPGGLGSQTGGDRSMAPLLARAAVAAGVHAVFMEVHDEPERARSDSAVQLPLHEVESLLDRLTRIHQVSSTHSDA